MAIFKTRIKIENSAKTTTNKKVVFTNEIPINVKAKHKKEITNGFLLSNFETNQPEVTVPNNALTGIIRNIEPN